MSGTAGNCWAFTQQMVYVGHLLENVGYCWALTQQMVYVGYLLESAGPVTQHIAYAGKCRDLTKSQQNPDVGCCWQLLGMYPAVGVCRALAGKCRVLLGLVPANVVCRVLAGKCRVLLGLDPANSVMSGTCWNLLENVGYCWALTQQIVLCWVLAGICWKMLGTAGP